MRKKGGIVKCTLDLFNDIRVLSLSDKETGEFRGSIIAKWTKSGVCHVLIRAKMPNGKFMVLKGKAGGYGYDKFSAAVSEALQDTPFKGTHDDMAPFVFCNSAEEYKNREKRGEELKARGIIPVYSGAGNVGIAFSLYYRVDEIL